MIQVKSSTFIWRLMLCYGCGWLLLSGPALAQNFIRLAADIPVERHGVQMELPFYGGLDRFIPQFIDIDSDGDFDLFMMESDGQLILLENVGSAQVPDFRLVAGAYKEINVQSWFYFVDIDADGDFDLYCSDGDNGLNFYRNHGSRSRPRLELEAQTLKTFDGQRILSEITSVPTFVDIDADRDFDFFTGVVTGEIRLYRNTGTPTSPAFTFETDHWQDLRIVSFGQTLGKMPPKNLPHGANILEFTDIDGDGDADCFYGDIFHRGLYFLRNEGTPAAAKMAVTDTLFPRPQPILTLGNNIPRFADIDADGDPDLFVAALQQQQEQFYFYQNRGTQAAPNFQVQAVKMLPMIDAGTNSAPAFADIDTDGDQDLFIGNLDGKISFYENTGTALAPAFRWSTDNLPNLQPSLHYSATPAFIDIDADGDRDLFSGSFFGKIVFYENRGSPRQPNFILSSAAFENIAVGYTSAPQFVDFDRDGDSDLFVSAFPGGVIYLYENVGDALRARFQWRRQIRHEFIIENAIPFFFDWNRDGLLDLFIGERNGAIIYYRGVAADSFALVQKDFAGLDAGFYAAPAFVDINGDHRIDLFVGEGDGGINFFQGTGSSVVANPTTPPHAFELNAYPNPFRERVHISLRAANKTAALSPQVVVYNLTGARVAAFAMTRVQNDWWQGVWVPQPANLVAGVYFLQINVGRERRSQKILFFRQ